jgi:rare lipoprotein A (peptidoglycan hydrolase)
MSAYLARTGLAVFALLLAIAMLTEHEAAGEALVASATTLELPALRELSPIRAVTVARIAVAGVETAPAASSETAAVGATVLASWYGPGFYGNRTACGQTYTPEILGVAHLTLPCGTALTLTYGGRSLTVHVIDRGPYVAGRALDLSSATKLALGCTDLCTVRMQIGR